MIVLCRGRFILRSKNCYARVAATFASHSVVIADATATQIEAASLTTTEMHFLLPVTYLNVQTRANIFVLCIRIHGHGFRGMK